MICSSSRIAVIPGGNRGIGHRAALLNRGAENFLNTIAVV
jgi:hypothetical protein